MLDKQVIDDIKAELLRMPAGKPRTINTGICDQISFTLSGTFHGYILKPIVMQWQYYSGNIIFPIAHPTLSAVDAYCKCELWDKNTEYGRRRYELLDLLIARCEYLLTN